MHAAIDWNNYKPTMTDSLCAKIVAAGFNRIIAQTQFPASFEPVAAACVGNHIGLDAVRYLYNADNYVPQAEQAIQEIRGVQSAYGARTRYLELDVEDETGNTSSALPQLRLAVAYAVQAGYKVRIYTSEGYWTQYMQNTEEFSSIGILLRNARWDGVAANSRSVGFGGWQYADATQYSGGVTVAGINVNPNVCEDSNFDE